MSDRRPRLAFAYDHRYPDTIGGAERYYAALCEELAREQPVTYLTRAFGEGPRRTVERGVEVLRLTRARPEPRSFVLRNARKALHALALAAHLARHGGRYDAVHVACFPHPAVLAARAGLLLHRRTRLAVDWHEVLPRAAWRGRLGRGRGTVGWLLQRLAVRAGDCAVTYSRLHERRLREEGRRGPIAVLPEFVPERRLPARAGEAGRHSTILFAGRLVAEKRAYLVPLALRELRRADPSWRALVFGDGEERARIATLVEAEGLAGALSMPGFVPWEELSSAMLSARCLLLPTVREGFGLVVLEAAAHGLPAVVVAEPDNAATELIAPGENGLVCRSADPAELAGAVRELAADAGIHARTRTWFERARARYSVEAAAAEHRALHERLRA